MSNPETQVLLEHLERDLGAYTGRGAARPETKLPFSLLQFDDRPRPQVTATVTFGVSAHVLRDREGENHRLELLVLLDRTVDEEALDIAANVGVYLLDEHVALLEGETVAMPQQSGSRLDTIVAATPDPFPARLASCERCDPPVEVIWLLPFARSESHLVVEHGWRDLLEALSDQGHAPWDLMRPAVL
jgi:hypothetical protein